MGVISISTWMRLRNRYLHLTAQSIEAIIILTLTSFQNSMLNVDINSFYCAGMFVDHVKFSSMSFNFATLSACALSYSSALSCISIFVDLSARSVHSHRSFVLTRLWPFEGHVMPEPLSVELM